MSTRFALPVRSCPPPIALFVAALICLGLSGAALADSAQAQLRGASSPALLPTGSITGVDDATAVDLNPANLGFLDAYSLTYIHAQASDGSAFSQEGDAVRLALPLFFGFSLGASAASVRPTTAAGGQDRGRLALALAWAPSNVWSFGGSLAWFGSGDPTVHGLTSLDLAASFRPSPLLGFSFVARDINGLFAFGSSAQPASFLLSAGLRPLGTRHLTLDLAGALDTDGRVGIRGGAEITVPYVGRVFGSLEANGLDESPELIAMAGVSMDWGGLSAGGGAVFGDGFGDGPGWFVSGQLSGVGRTGLPLPRYLADFAVGGLGPRGLISLVYYLDRAIRDEGVHGVLLRFQGSGIGTAYAQELRVAIDQLRQAGKPVICHFEAASGPEYYACAAATRTYLDPAGGIRLYGPQLTSLLLGDLLRNVGIRADFVRIGNYKSAVEQFTNHDPSPPALEQRGAFLDDLYGRWLSDLGRDLDRDETGVRDLIDNGPYLASEAIGAQMIAGAADGFDLDSTLADDLGGRFRRLESPPRMATDHWGERARIGVVVVDGDIVDGENVDLPIPLLPLRMSGGHTIVRTIDQMAADPRIRAIIVRVDSPGGSALASDQIWRAMMRAREQKPVIASMGSVAASGGYYIASAAEEIWADPSTLTGSIGIFAGKVDFEPLLEEIGVGVHHLQRGRRAGMESLYRPFTADERASVVDKIRIWYRLFLQRIAAGRSMSIEDIDRVARGRIWSGDAALQHGLVDRLGGFQSALIRARQLASLDAGAPIVVAPSRPGSLVELALDSIGLRAEAGAETVLSPDALQAVADLPTEQQQAFQVLMMMATSGEDQAMARLPFITDGL